MKYNFSLVFFSISLCASFASATKGFLDGSDDQSSQRSSQQNTPGCTPKRSFEATDAPGAPRRHRSNRLQTVSANVAPRRLFQGEPARLPASPDARPPLWEGIAARAAADAAIAAQAPAALPEDDVASAADQAAEQARIEREEQDYLALQEALDIEQALAEEEAIEDARRAQMEAAIRVMIQRRGYGDAPCRVEGPGFGSFGH
jgi:hypothetical protein